MSFKIYSLRKLDLSHNIIQSITKDMIDHLKYSLRWLSVADNRLRDIPEGLGEFDTLDYLDISRNMQIRFLRTGIVGCKIEYQNDSTLDYLVII